MNTEVDKKVEEIKPVIGSRRELWRWLFVQPPIGGCPVGHAQRLVHRLTSATLRPRPDIFTRVIVARTQAYDLAGCPENLSEYAACRDLWNVLHHQS